MREWTIINLGLATASNYRRSKNIASQVYRKAKEKNDKEIIGGMISDCQFVEDWLETGRRPGSVRGIERRSREQRTSNWDPNWFDSYESPDGWAVERELTSSEKFQIEDALSTLSKRERQCYTLHHAMGFSYRQIAMELLISRSSVQTNIERAEKKIQENKQSSLFLMG